MKKILFPFLIAVTLLSSCSLFKPVKRNVAYKGMYEEKPLTILLMPPINKTTNIEAKEYFHSTLNVPLADAGYYVIPTFLSMEILKKESAYDAELFLNSSLAKFGEVFGSDLVLFTVIHKWEKSILFSTVTIEIEYIIKSTKTNEVVYTRTGNVVYDPSSKVSGGGLVGLASSIAISAIETAVTKYVDVARKCNEFTFLDLPAGKYSPKYGTDGEKYAGLKKFHERIQ